MIRKRLLYVTNGKNPDYRTAALQYRDNVRADESVELPQDLLAEIDTSAVLYYGKRAKDEEAKANEKVRWLKLNEENIKAKGTQLDSPLKGILSDLMMARCLEKMWAPR